MVKLNAAIEEMFTIAPLPCFFHLRYHTLRTQKRAFQIGIEDDVPVCFALFGNRLNNDHSSVVDENVDLAKAVERCF